MPPVMPPVMLRPGFAPEERLGLLLAVALHAGVLALLLSHRADKVIAPPPRMEVTLTDKVGLTDSAPNTHEQAAADIAPQLGTAPPPPPPPPPPPAKAHPLLPMPMQLPPPPLERQAPRPFPAPLKPPPPKPAPSPVKPTPVKPAPAKPTSLPTVRPSPLHAEVSPIDRLARNAQTTAKTSAKTTGGSRIGADFLKGVTSANTTGKAKTPPAQTAGPAMLATLPGIISRQLKPHWTPPLGADADKLVSFVDVHLNPDGTLDGPPRVVRQEGVTDSNRPQSARHAEQAIRAVELAEPFPLPPEYYNSWKHLTLRFDWNLSR